MDIQILKPEERNYTYSQSQQISMQTGCIGHLRADMDTNGEGFFSSWDDFRKDLKTQVFKDEFDDVINELRSPKVASSATEQHLQSFATHILTAALKITTTNTVSVWIAMSMLTFSG